MIRRLLSVGLWATIPMLTGCLHFVHPTPAVDAHTWRPADRVPDEHKSCVYLFLFDPLDPFTCANLAGVRDFAQDLGFGKTFYGQPCHVSYFLQKMHQIRGHCGSARFVVIGYDTGAEGARQLTSRAAEAGIPVAQTIYLEPRRVEPWTDEETQETITVRAADLAVPDDESSSKDVRKSDVPTHPDTLALVERELTLAAMTVPPPPRPDAKRVILVPPIPAPRTTEPKPRPLPDEWQFLRPRHPSEIPPLPHRPKTEPLPLPKVVPELPPPKAGG